MNISTTTQISQLPRAHEASALRPRRDSDSINTLWKKVTELVDSVNKSNQVVNQLTREFKKLQSRTTLDLEMHPFKIYTLPVEFRPPTDSSLYTGSANWRTVRVRGGLILTQLVSTSSFVIGTDMMQNYSYYNFLPSSSIGNYDIQVPINQPEYFFWIENSSSVNGGSPTNGPYYLRYDSNPTNTGSAGNPNGWLNFPSASVNTYIPIGYCDTFTSASQNIMYVRQLLATDVIATGGGSGSSGYKWSIYIPSSSYTADYDIVSLRDGSSNSGDYYCVQSTTMSINPPVYPEPVSNIFWRNARLGPFVTTNCSGSTVYFDSTPF